ncbi:prothymosin alpha-B isoform 1-T1 [Clarias gariepinus]|uniref:prothymosin alpha-B isoform X1 n=1 Tax=Clarias gariepinus TaxID=13013 RepID=UPI00234E2F4C|nr:prothymosin alpha-B isoform X1 [Clarias gariepinus]
MESDRLSASMKQRIVMKFLVKEGVKPIDIYRRLQAQYGIQALSRSKTFDWCKRFKEGRTSVNDDPGRGGSGPTAVIPVNIQRVENLILENPLITCRQIAEETHLSVGTVHTIIHERLHFRKDLKEKLLEEKENGKEATNGKENEENGEPEIDDEEEDEVDEEEEEEDGEGDEDDEDEEDEELGRGSKRGADEDDEDDEEEVDLKKPKKGDD